MKTPEYQITCTKNEQIARDIYEIKFSKPENFSFQPGQFVLFDVPLVDDPSDIETRSVSIGSSPDEEDLLCIMKMKKGGRISRWIEEKLTVGSDMTMKGPFGFFLLDRETTKDYLMIATSTGVAPFRSQVLALHAADETRQVDLVFGVREEQDLFWQEEFEKLAQDYESFFLHLALSQPTDAWKGHKGWVQTLVPQIVQDFSNKSVYVCGSPEMTKEVKGLCLEKWGVAKEDLHGEGYI